MDHKNSEAPAPLLRCLEIIGSFEVFAQRELATSRLPYQRLGRIRSTNGKHLLAYLIDFGTARERYAADDTWTEGQARAYVKMRMDVASALIPSPIESGVIIPPDEGAQLPGGHYIPPGHLEALPRIFLIDKRPDGLSLTRVLQGPRLSPLAARGVLVALGQALNVVGPRAEKDGLLPGHLDLEVWLRRSGSVEIRPCFRYIQSADFLYSVSDLRAAEAPKNTLAGHLADTLETLINWSKAHDGDAAWASKLLPLCKGIDDCAAAWSLGKASIPISSRDQQDALAEHLNRNFAEPGGLDDDLARRVLSAPPPDSGVQRWQTRQLSI